MIDPKHGKISWSLLVPFCRYWKLCLSSCSTVHRQMQKSWDQGAPPAHACYAHYCKSASHAEPQFGIQAHSAVLSPSGGVSASSTASVDGCQSMQGTCGRWLCRTHSTHAMSLQNSWSAWDCNCTLLGVCSNSFLRCSSMRPVCCPRGSYSSRC